MSKHKKQHFIPQCYLKAWCDPNTPPGQEPYVWVFNKDGTGARRKAPENVFRERDLYTIQGADGGRNLVLEHGLSGLESEFASIRDAKLGRGDALTPEEHLMLCAFVAAAHARTPTQRDHFAGQWGKVLEKMNRMAEWAETATPEQRRRAATSLGHGSGPSVGYDDVRRIVEKPMESMLVPMVTTETPLLMRLDLLVLTSAEAAFITSDYPCVWFDPEGYKRAPFYQGPALIYKSIEITLPVSPRQMILLNRQGLSGYTADLPERIVEEYNRRTRFACSEHFVNCRDATNPLWFEPGVEPEDSWRKLHPEGRALNPPPPVAGTSGRG